MRHAAERTSTQLAVCGTQKGKCQALYCAWLHIKLGPVDLHVTISYWMLKRTRIRYSKFAISSTFGTKGLEGIIMFRILECFT